MTAASPTPPVVKLGGSLFGAATLDALLDVAARHAALVVAGGGPFADAVRAAQATLGFDDAAAHRAAILAMEQSAHVLSSRRPDFARCATTEEIAEAAQAHRPALWFPARMALGADLPNGWDVTSDSLALWLAIGIDASRLALVKAAAVAPGGTAEDWSAAGLVDRFFPVLAPRFAGTVACIGEASAAALDMALSAPARIAA